MGVLRYPQICRRPTLGTPKPRPLLTHIYALRSIESLRAVITIWSIFTIRASSIRLVVTHTVTVRHQRKHTTNIFIVFKRRHSFAVSLRRLRVKLSFEAFRDELRVEVNYVIHSMYYNVAEAPCQVKNKIYLLNPKMGLRGHGQQVRCSFPCVVAYPPQGMSKNYLRRNRIRHRRNASSQRVVVGLSLQTLYSRPYPSARIKQGKSRFI